MNRISKIVVLVFSIIFCGCIGESETSSPAPLKTGITSVDYTCRDLAEARPRILATLRQAGLLDVIVKIAGDSELLVITKLSAKDTKTESIAKFSTIAAAVAKFVTRGDLKVMFVGDGSAKGNIVSLSCKIANARAVSAGTMTWPEFVNTVEISPGVK